MSTQKQQQPRNDETPPRRSDRPEQGDGKVAPRDSTRAPQTAPIAKRSDQVELDGPPTEKKRTRKKQKPSDIPKYQ